MDIDFSWAGRRAVRGLLAAATLGVLSAIAAPARAQTPDCSTLNLPNPIYGDGGSAAQQHIGKLATVLANQNPPVTVLFKAAGGCAAIYGVQTPTTLSGSVFYWDAGGVQKSCNLPAVGGPTQQWGNMVNSHLLCPSAPATLPANIGVIESAVTAVNFITHKDSTETSISSEAAYFIYGYGNNSNVAPWTNEAFIFKRNQNSAVGLYAGLAIGVQPTAQKGMLISNQSMGVNGVAGANPVSSGLAYVSSDAADAARATVKTLAYQHKGQVCGYLPDSTSSSFDKRNVRDGHYWLWGAQHYYFIADPTTHAPVDANVAKLIALANADTAPAGVDANKLAIDTGNIPRCAMNVWRDGDLGELYSYAPPVPCACYFEKTIPGGATSCKACTTDTDCASVSANSKCRLNLCEAY